MGDDPKVLRKRKDNGMLWGNTVIVEGMSVQQISAKKRLNGCWVTCLCHLDVITWNRVIKLFVKEVNYH